MQPEQTTVLIIGSSLSGLACAASLKKQNLEYVIIEKENQIASPWRNHYDRLHLHTNKRHSNLPYKKLRRNIPRYPSRQQVIDYLEQYQEAFTIQPVFSTEAKSIRWQNDCWLTETTSGSFQSKYVIIATGPFSKPRPIHFNGMETFSGKIMHSYEYKTGKAFKGENVLVVGFGNSACEIAIDLYEQGAKPSMAVRSPVNVLPRDVFGIPILELSLVLNRLPPRVADVIGSPLMKWLIGDLTKLGLKKMPYGPLEEIRKDANAPVLDIGTIQHIRKGHIKIYDDIESINGKTVVFKDGRKENFDAMVAAIGYDRNYAEIVNVDKSRFEDLRVSIDKQKYFGKDGLYFCGYWISPTGQIREIALDAKKIAADIARKENGMNK